MVAELQGPECRDDHQRHEVDAHALEPLPERARHRRTYPRTDADLKRKKGGMRMAQISIARLAVLVSGRLWGVDA